MAPNSQCKMPPWKKALLITGGLLALGAFLLEKKGK
jgi:hypothetical protein